MFSHKNGNFKNSKDTNDVNLEHSTNAMNFNLNKEETFSDFDKEEPPQMCCCDSDK